MRVAEGAAVKYEAAHTIRQLAIGDGARRLRGIEGERNIDLAVGEKPAEAAIVARKGAPAPPEVWMGGVEPGEEGRRGGSKVGVIPRLREQCGIGSELDEELIQEGGAGKIGRLRIGEASGILLSPFEKGGSRCRRVRKPRRVVEENQPGHAPGRFKPLDGDGEVALDRRLVLHVDETIVRQPGCPADSLQQAVRLHGGKILAIDPDEIDGAALFSPGGLLGQHTRDDLRRVAHLHMDDADAEALQDGLAGPGDIIVDARIAAPGMKINRLALRLGEHRIPVRRIGHFGAGGEDRGQQGDECKKDAHHMLLPGAEWRRQPLTCKPSFGERPARGTTSLDCHPGLAGGQDRDP
jgi:hypothetical protein